MSEMPDVIWATDKAVDGYQEEWFPFHVDGATKYHRSSNTVQLGRDDIKKLVKALTPLAQFAESLKPWKIGTFSEQEEYPIHKPVLRRTYPCDTETMYVRELYVEDFRAAQEALSLLSAAMEGKDV